MVGKVWVRNVESGWFLAGSRLDWRFLGELWDGLDGSWAWTVGSVIRFLEVSRGVRRL